MTEEEWVLVDKVQGQLQAELIRGLLEAQGITVWLNSQGAARAYAVTVGTLGAVEILVPSSAAEQAKQILDAYYKGEFDNIELTGPEEGQDDG